MMWTRRFPLGLVLILGAAGCDDGAGGADTPDRGRDRGVLDAGLDSTVDVGARDARAPDAQTGDADQRDSEAIDARMLDQSVADGTLPDVGLDGQAPDAGEPGACGDPAQGQPVCGGLCGDGVRSTCQGLIPNRPPPPFDAGVPEITEACDGDDHGGQTCESMGYLGGDLNCDDACAIDQTGCQFCVPNPRVSACRLATEDFIPESFAMALGDRIAVVWVARTQQGTSGFFSTYDSDTLEPIDAVCLGAGVTGVAVAAVDDGFVVAMGDIQTRDIRLLLVSAEGQTVALGPPAQGVRVSLHAVAGGTLMVWTDNANASSARLINADGEAVWTTQLFDSELGRASVIDVPGGYLVAQRSSVPRDGGRHSGVVVARLAADGELLGYAFPARPSTEYPSLAADGDQIRLTFADFGGEASLYWAALDASGELVSEALLGAREAFNPAPTVVVGDASFVLQGQHTGRTDHAAQLSLHRYNGEGGADEAGGATVIINQSGVYSAFWQMLRAGDDLIVGWIEAGTGLGLARVSQ